MLRVDFRELRQGPVETIADLEPGDPVFEGTEVDLAGPVAVRGRLQEAGHGEFFWQATLSGRVKATCRRCLAEVVIPVESEVGVLFSDAPEAADDPSMYPLPQGQGVVDLREAVREEWALAVPVFVLCREGCAGLCPQCGADLNVGPCGCAAPAEPD